MKRFFSIIFRPFYWLWKIFSSGLSVLSNLLFLSLILLIIAASLYAPEISVPNGSALVLAPKGNIVEERSPMDLASRMISKLTGTPLHAETFLQDILDAVHAAAGDPRIDLLVINPNRMEGASLDQIRSIGEALEQFKSEGKQVIGGQFQSSPVLPGFLGGQYLSPPHGGR